MERITKPKTIEQLANLRQKVIEEELERQHKQLGARCPTCDGQLDYEGCTAFRRSFRRDD